MPTHATPPLDILVHRRDEVAMQAASEDLLDLGAIVMCEPCSEQFLSSYFLVLKSNGTMRFVLNLKQFNKYIVTEHFQMEDVRTAIKLITRGCFFGQLEFV